MHAPHSQTPATMRVRNCTHPTTQGVWLHLHVRGAAEGHPHRAAGHVSSRGNRGDRRRRRAARCQSARSASTGDAQLRCLRTGRVFSAPQVCAACHGPNFCVHAPLPGYMSTGTCWPRQRPAPARRSPSSSPQWSASRASPRWVHRQPPLEPQRQPTPAATQHVRCRRRHSPRGETCTRSRIHPRATPQVGLGGPIRCLVLAPSRELAEQIRVEAEKLLSAHGLGVQVG